jgi:hypothetical protein
VKRFGLACFRERISRFLNVVAQPKIAGRGLAEFYAAMAADEAREAEAVAWAEVSIADIARDWHR